MFDDQKVYDLVKDSIFDNERDSVAYRFGIAIFQKTSYVQNFVKQMYNNRIQDWAKDELKRYKPEEQSVFQPIYLSSQIYNMVSASGLQEIHRDNANGVAKVLIVLFDILGKDYPGDCVLIIGGVMMFIAENSSKYKDAILEANYEDNISKILSNYLTWSKDQKNMNDDQKQSFNDKLDECKATLEDNDRKDKMNQGKEGGLKGKKAKDAKGKAVFQQDQIIFESFKDEVI